MEKKIFDRQSMRFHREKRNLSFDVVLAEDVESIFTSKQTQLLEQFRDGADRDYKVAEALDISPNTEKGIKSEIVGRMKKAFGKNPGKEAFQRALGVSIIAGWVQPREREISLNELECKAVDLLLYGFSRDEAAKILLMEKNKFVDRLVLIKDRIGVKTDLELVAARASEIRRLLLKVRKRKID